MDVDYKTAYEIISRRLTDEVVKSSILEEHNRLLEQQLIKQADPFSNESAVKDSDDAN